MNSTIDNTGHNSPTQSKRQYDDSPHLFYKLIPQKDYSSNPYAASKYTIIKQLTLPIPSAQEETLYYVVLDKSAQLAAEITRMSAQIDRLRSVITEGHAKKVETSQQAYIQILHDYNDLKDCTQSLLGLMAMKEGVTVESLYPQYDLDLSD